MKPKASMLIQMRTGKIGLNNYLHRIKASDTKLCFCGNTENVYHVLLQCPKWANFKKEIFGPGEISKNLTELLDNPTLAKKSTTFMKNTKLLTQYGHFNNESDSDLDVDNEDRPF